MCRHDRPGTATASQATSIAEGFTTVDQRAGGVLGPDRTCASRRRITIRVRSPRRGERVVRLRATATRGRVRVIGTRRIVLDLRGARRGTVRLRVVARTSKGRTLRQTRTYRTCASRASLRHVVGG